MQEVTQTQESGVTETPLAVEMRHIRKAWPGVIANDDVTFSVRQRSRGASGRPSSQRCGASSALGWTCRALSRIASAASARTSCSGGLSWRCCHRSTWARALGASSIMR